MSEVRDDVEKAFDKYGLAAVGTAAGAILGRKLSKSLYRGRARVKGPHGTQSVGIQSAGKQRPGDVNRGFISADSPLGRGLRGKKAGDTVTIKNPGGGSSRYEVVSMKDNGFMVRSLAVGTTAAVGLAGAAANKHRKK